MLSIETNGNTTEFAPGQTIEGTAGWDRTSPPRDAVLRLFWYTEGRGTQDVGVAAEQAFGNMQPIHREPFRFEVPKAPYSFSGKLVSLRWALELLVDRGKEVERLNLLVTPWVKEPELGVVEEEEGAKKKWGFKLG